MLQIAKPVLLYSFKFCSLSQSNALQYIEKKNDDTGSLYGVITKKI